MTLPDIRTGPRSIRTPSSRPPNWFVVGFLVAIGVVLAVGLWAGGGAQFVRDELARHRIKSAIEAKRSQVAAKTEQARNFAMPELAKRGISELSEDASVTEDGLDTVLVGTGRDKSRNLRSVFVRFRVATFNGREHWKLVSVVVEGE